MRVFALDCSSFSTLTTTFGKERYVFVVDNVLGLVDHSEGSAGNLGLNEELVIDYLVKENTD